jgi:3-methyladenine DNA glycosylase Tag
MTKQNATAEIGRCPWAKGEQYVAYHDSEWGVPVHDDRLLFEFLILEGAQAGLSWSTILKKRDNYRTAFDHFDPAVVARYGARKRTALLNDEGIVRNSASVQRIRHVRRIHLAIRRGPSPAERLAEHERSPCTHSGVRRHEQRPQTARLQFRRQHHLLRLHAGRRLGERPPGRMLPAPPTAENTARHKIVERICNPFRYGFSRPNSIGIRRRYKMPLFKTASASAGVNT